MRSCTIGMEHAKDKRSEVGCAGRLHYGDACRRPAMEDGNKPIFSLLPLTNPNLMASRINCWSPCGGRGGEFGAEAYSRGDPVCHTSSGSVGGNQCFRVSYRFGLGVSPVYRGDNRRARNQETWASGRDSLHDTDDADLLV